MLSIEIKSALHAACLAEAEARIEAAQKALKSAKESAANETKSSMGDKYETGRAMAQIEQAKASEQIEIGQKLLHQLKQVNPEKSCEKVEKGALIKCTLGTLYISVAIGKISLYADEIPDLEENLEVFSISAGSPIAKAMWNAKAGEQLKFNGKQLRVEDIV